MNRLYFFLKTINKARSVGSLPETKYNSLRSTLRLFFDLLFFKDTRSISIFLDSWLSMYILNLFSANFTFLFFFQEIKKIDLKKYYDGLYRVNEVTPLILRLYPSKKFQNIKSNLNPFILESSQTVFNNYEIYLDSEHELIKTLIISDFISQNVSTEIALTSFSSKYGINLNKKDCDSLVLYIFYLGSNYLNSKMIWASSEDIESLSKTFLNLNKKFDIIKLYEMNLKNTSYLINKNFKNIDFKDILPLNQSSSLLNDIKYFNNDIKKKNLVKVSKKKLSEEILILGDNVIIAKPFIDSPLIFISFVNNMVSSKSYTMRSRQFYRSGVLWCLVLTLITIITPYYLFYGFIFLFDYWWFFTLMFFLRYSIVLLWKLTPVKIKFKISDYLNI